MKTASPARKPGCNAPDLGATASLLLGRDDPLEPELAAHIESCLSCRLERLAFHSLEHHTVEPSARSKQRLRKLARSTR